MLSIILLSLLFNSAAPAPPVLDNPLPVSVEAQDNIPPSVLKAMEEQKKFQPDPILDTLPDSLLPIKQFCSTNGIPVGDANVKALCLKHIETGEIKISVSIDESLVPPKAQTVVCDLVYAGDTKPITLSTDHLYIPEDKPADDNKKKKKKKSAEEVNTYRSNSVLQPSTDFMFPITRLLSVSLTYYDSNRKQIGEPRIMQLQKAPATPSSDGATPAPPVVRRDWPPIQPHFIEFHQAPCLFQCVFVFVALLAAPCTLPYVPSIGWAIPAHHLLCSM